MIVEFDRGEWIATHRRASGKLLLAYGATMSEAMWNCAYLIGVNNGYATNHGI